MAYLASQNTVILQVPKSGSSSLIHAAATLGELTDVGHHPASYYTANDARIIAVVRDPIDRLVSAINYYYPRGPLDGVMRHIKGFRYHQAAFKPQSWFIDTPNVDVYQLSDIGDALASIGYHGDVPQKNPSNKWLTRPYATQSTSFMGYVERYKGDYDLLS